MTQHTQTDLPVQEREAEPALLEEAVLTKDAGDDLDTEAQAAQNDAPAPQAPANLPQKFWDADAGEVRLEALVNSYTALERRLSQLTAPPQTDADRERMLRLLGRPESPHEYEVAVPHGLLAPDPEVNARLHKRGCTQEQVQEVYDLAAEKLLDAIRCMACEVQADREIERLVAHFGGADKWAEVARQLLAFGQNALPPHVLDNLASSFEGVLALHRMMQSGVSAMPSPRGADGSDAPVVDRRALDEMLHDPRYWKHKEPEFVAQVTDGFRRLYGEA